MTRWPFVVHSPEAGRVLKADAAPTPCAIFGGDILGDENDSGGPSDEPGFAGFRLRGDERKERTAIRRGDGQPPVTGFEFCVEGKIESELIEVESQALILISYIDVDGVNTEMEAAVISAVRGIAHGRD